MQPLIACLVLTGVHGLFVMAEYSIVKTSNGKGRVSDPSGISGELSRIHEKLEEYLLVSQIGKTGALLGMGMLLGSLLSGSSQAHAITGTDSFLFMPGQFVLALIVIGLTQLVLGQEVPKYWGVMYSEQCAESLSSFMRFSYILVWPMVWIIKYLSHVLAHR